MTTATPTADDFEVSFEQRVLPCPLTDKDRLERATMLVELSKQKAVLEIKKKTEAKALKEAIDTLAVRMNGLYRQLDEGQVDKPVEVKVVHDFNRNVITALRTDTGEVMEERVMPAEDRQRALDLETPEQHVYADYTDEALSERLTEVRNELFSTQLGEAREQELRRIESDLLDEIDTRTQDSLEADGELDEEAESA